MKSTKTLEMSGRVRKLREAVCQRLKSAWNALYITAFMETEGENMIRRAKALAHILRI